MRSRAELFPVFLLAACGTAELDPISDAGDTPDASESECPPSSTLSYESFGEPFFLAWCTGCHSSALSGSQRANAPLGVDFDSFDGVRASLARIRFRATGDAPTMPPAGGPPQVVRHDLAEWIACGAPSSRADRPDAGARPPPPDGGQTPLDAQPASNLPAFSSTGEYASPVTPDAVFCGPMTCDPRGGGYCCIDGDGPRCVTGPADCQLHLGCDGPEDCTGSLCCLTPLPGRARLECGATCGTDSFLACHRAAECPEAIPVCCRGAENPFGRCTTRVMAAPGEQCDTR